MIALLLGQDAISKVTKRRWVIVSTVSIAGMILLSLVVTLYLLKKRLKRKGTTELNNEGAETNERQEDLELPLFDLDTILNATHNFSRTISLERVVLDLSTRNQGQYVITLMQVLEPELSETPFFGFESLKGMLQDGKEIAVKRLSKESNQGLDEFKMKLYTFPNFSTRNLVKLLGCCIHGEKRYGIQSMVLDWPKRFVIINGIARGLLYLHQDSRLRIIHRDLKADNVLLDNEMNPRISDFGMARSFGGNETQARTKRVVGTYGYMSPEYAIDGVYSVKSDVFSFGAWTLYMEGTPLELIDASVGYTYNQSEVLRALNVGLLCVQRHPDDRPNMSSVVLMLSSEGALPQPKEPGFFTERNMLEADSLQCKHAVFSGNEHTITILEGR
ncbi:G-type lectin S-receptor-like serine/threonine-protein kinase SD1-1 [Vitis vinifera]|uniref:non-specific serine/threonine protein kinase n=1 Tax=Vitis vinifera TaxID=29760 RepID=A0A438BPN1_VITVI|nr:G-type lectin S-receptor-like serine/threonine-protein kinase SD1-1 [Vitis vinifera]